jgi:single-strand DNA-binding protein
MAVGHPSGLIALRLPPHTSGRLSFFPFFLLKKCFLAGVEEDAIRLFHLKLYIMDITGRVTADAQVRTLSDDRTVVNFSVAVNDSYKAKNGERITQTEFFDCSYWVGSGIAQYLTKGSIVELSGRVSARAWVDSEGQPKAGLNFHTSKITLHGSGATADKPQAKQPAKSEPTAIEVTGTQVSPNGQDDDLPF